nr:CMF_HP1_G0046250.mRNA.1.CDS.1 [Saccharomyces cerevisiae]
MTIKGYSLKSFFYPTSDIEITPIVVDDNTRYSQLNTEQINFLENEAKDIISKKSKSWCWYEAIPHISNSSNIIDSHRYPRNNQLSLVQDQPNAIAIKQISLGRR